MPDRTTEHPKEEWIASELRDLAHHLYGLGLNAPGEQIERLADETDEAAREVLALRERVAQVEAERDHVAGYYATLKRVRTCFPHQLDVCDEEKGGCLVCENDALAAIAREAVAEIENVGRGWHAYAVEEVQDPEWGEYEPGGNLRALRARLDALGGATGAAPFSAARLMIPSMAGTRMDQASRRAMIETWKGTEPPARSSREAELRKLVEHAIVQTSAVLPATAVLLSERLDEIGRGA
jgi:hypothetical protein